MSASSDQGGSTTSQIAVKTQSEPPWLETARWLIGRFHSCDDSILQLADGIAEAFPETSDYCNLVTPTTPWCALFVAYVFASHNIRPPFAPRDEARSFLRAYSWSVWGDKVSPKHRRPGDIVILDINGGHHVGFYVSDRNGRCYMLGGNQEDQVKIKDYASRRCVAIRRPSC